MTWTAVGSLFASTSASLAVAPTAVGQLALVTCVSESATVYNSGISGGHCTWAQIGSPFKGTNTAYYVTLWAGTSTATGSATATLAYSGTMPTVRTSGQLYASSVGTWSVVTQGYIDVTSGATYPSLSPVAAGELYHGYAWQKNGTLNVGSTSGYVYAYDPNYNGQCYNLSCGSGTQAPTWSGTADTLFGTAVLVAEVVLLSGTAGLSGSGSLTGTGVFAGSTTLSGIGTITPTPTHTSGSRGVGTASLSGTGSLAPVTPTGTFTQSATLNGSGTLSATWIGLLQQPPNVLSGLGSLGVSGEILGFPAALAGQGTLSVLQATGGLVFTSAGASTSQAYPGASQVAVAPPGSSNWYFLGSLGRITALTYSFICPGGADRMSCTLMVPASYRNQYLNPGWQVRITRGGHTVWTGRMDEPVPSSAGWTMTAVGDGNRGADFLANYTSTWPASQPDESVSNAISRGLPWVNPGIGTPAGAWFGQSVDSGAQTITALLNLVCTRGALTWYANSQPGGKPGTDITVFPLPTVPNRLLSCTTPVARTLGGDINTIFIRYQVTADTVDGSGNSVAATFSVTSVQNVASVTAHDVIETFIDLSDVGVMTAGAAQAVGNNVLKIYQRASFAGPFTGRYGQLMNPGGTPIDPGTEQAGTMVRLILTDYGYGGEVTPQFPVQFIVGSYEWDDIAGQFSIIPYQSVNQSLTGLLSLANTELVPITVASGP